MPTTTEICNLHLIAGTDIGDPNHPASKVMKECGDTMVAQDGMQQLQFGREIENAQILQLLLNWDDIKKHQEFTQTDAYGPFLDKFKTIFEGAPEIIHVDFQPDGGLAASLAAPVTEVATFYFDGGPPGDALEGVKQCIANMERETGIKTLGWAYGFTHEEIEREGVKGKGAVLTIGWESVQQHMDLRQTESFKNNIGLLRNGAQKIEMHHTTFMLFKP